MKCTNHVDFLVEMLEIPTNFMEINQVKATFGWLNPMKFHHFGSQKSQILWNPHSSWRNVPMKSYSNGEIPMKSYEIPMKSTMKNRKKPPPHYGQTFSPDTASTTPRRPLQVAAMVEPRLVLMCSTWNGEMSGKSGKILWKSHGKIYEKLDSLKMEKKCVEKWFSWKKHLENDWNGMYIMEFWADTGCCYVGWSSISKGKLGNNGKQLVTVVKGEWTINPEQWRCLCGGSLYRYSW